jgi:hypothetical protein
MKPLDQLTPDEIQAFPEKAKTGIAMLALKQTPRAKFLVDCGSSISKANRADRRLLRDNDSWWEAHGIIDCGGIEWQTGQSRRCPILFIKVVDWKKGNPVEGVKISTEYPEEAKKCHLPFVTPQFTRLNDGRWRSTHLVGGEDFTLTVQAPGYRPASQKLNLPPNVTKELEVKLQKE